VRPAPELSIIVPTFNERANVPILVERLNRTKRLRVNLHHFKDGESTSSINPNSAISPHLSFLATFLVLIPDRLH
jgi:hypothetical protein